MTAHMKPTARQITNAVAAFLLFSTAYLVGLLFYWQAYPYKTADVMTPIEVTNQNKEVAAGGKLNMTLQINKQSDVTPLISRSIICQHGAAYLVPAPDSSGTSRPQGRYAAPVSFDVPSHIPAGSLCVFEYQNDYRVNPIRVIAKKWQSEQFKVVSHSETYSCPIKE